MSFILDALRKSETDRQQKAAPGIADVPIAKPGGRAPRWLPIVIGLLAVNLAAVLYLLLRPDPEPSVAAETRAGQDRDAGAVASVDLARIAPQAEPAPVVPAAGMPARASVAETMQAATAPAAHAMPGPAIDSGEASAATPDPGEPADPPEPGAAAGSTADDETWLTLNDLRASGNLDLPEMHIDLHVYSDKPGERFVFINMNQYRENATLAEGPRVRRITPEGVILDYRGSTFLLPRE